MRGGAQTQDSLPGNQKAARGKAAGGFEIGHHEEVSVLGRPGSDLLFQVLRLSTIGAGKFYGRVRDGIGYRLPANTTRPAKDREAENRIAAAASIQAGLASSTP